jgi:hypothetical protein
MAWMEVTDFRYPAGWSMDVNKGERGRFYAEQLEAGQILMFPGLLFDLPAADQERLLSLRKADSRYHKNISYRPRQDLLRGAAPDRPEDARELHRIMRAYSRETTETLARFLAPYAAHWMLDYASFRPLEEQGRDLPLHQRNDLLHVDAFPSRPTQGGRILRVFTNLNPDHARVWLTTDPFDTLAPRMAKDAGLSRIAAGATSPLRALTRGVTALRRAAGMGGPERSAYDQFMLRFHDFLKENSRFQAETPKTRHEFPPLSTWIVFTDGVPHAALSGQFALEQTYVIPVDALLAPHLAPLRVLEKLCGRSLSARG